MDIITIIILLGIFQGVFFGILLLTTRRGNRLANRLLGILMILFSISISGFLFNRLGYSSYPSLIQLPPAVLFLFGPFFYFYVKSLTGKDFSLQVKDILHTLPFFILLSGRIINIILTSDFDTGHFNTAGMLIISLQIIHLFIYLYYSNKVINEFKQFIKKQTASIDEINLGWLKFIINSFMVIFGIIIIFVLLYFAGFEFFKLFGIIIPVSVTIAIYILGYKGWQQPEILKFEEENGKIKNMNAQVLRVRKVKNIL